MRAHAPSLPPLPLLPCEGTRPSLHPSFARRTRPSGRCCCGRRCSGADLRHVRGGRGLRARVLASRRRHRCCLQASGREEGHGKRAGALCASSSRPSSFQCLAAAWPLLLRSSLFRRRLRVGGRRAWLCGHVPRASCLRHCFRVRGRGHRTIPRPHGVRGRLAAVLIAAARAPISVRRAAGKACRRVPWPPAAAIAVSRQGDLVAQRHPAHLCLGSLIAPQFLRWR